jgi:hypothetical protein
MRPGSVSLPSAIATPIPASKPVMNPAAFPAPHLENPRNVVSFPRCSATECSVEASFQCSKLLPRAGLAELRPTVAAGFRNRLLAFVES